MRKIGVALGLGLFAAAASAAPAPWLEIKSPHFTVITNSGEKQGRRTTWQFEQIRQALLVIWPWAHIDGGRPIEVFAVRDESTLMSLAPQYWEGKRFRPTSFWVTGVDRQYIALRTDLAEPDDAGENPYQTAYWNYVSLVFHRSLPVGVPAWYSRGVAEVLSNTIVREKELHVGRLMSDNLQRVRENALIPLDEFLGVERGSRYLTREVDAWQFDAQAWAFVHFLIFGDRGAHASRVNRFNQLLTQGTAAETAMKEAFGPDMTPYFSGMRDYVKRQLFQYRRIPVALGLKPEGFLTRALSGTESGLLRSSFLVAMNRPVEARGLAAEVSKAEPLNSGPFEIEGLLLDRERKSAEALLAYGKAVDLGSKRAQAHYRLAQLTRPPGGADKATNEKVAGMLERAIDLEPDFANALSFLADVKGDLGQSEDAVVLAQKAVKIQPDSYYHRLALARALWNNGRADEAITSAQSALSVADTEEGRGYAQRFLDFAARAPRPAPRPAASPATSTGRPVEPVLPAGSPTLTRTAGSADAATVESCVTHRDDASCAKAAPILQAMCDQKEGYACRAVGSLHDGGFGVPMDKMAAGAAYDAGCRGAGDLPSCARHAVLQVQGLGVQRDSAAGLATLQRLCGDKVDDACIGWALILAGRTEGRNVPKARSLLQASCDGRNEEACRALKSLPAR